MTRTVTVPLALLALVGCNGSVARQDHSSAGVIMLELPDGLRRAPVLFDHARHTAAMKQEGCQACHEAGDAGFKPQFVRSATMEQYHERCLGCHRERKGQGKPTGAVTCGECHVEQHVPAPERASMRFDYSLHARHVKASGGKESCKACHHVYDRNANKLVPGEGKEEGCAACHGAKDRARVLSLQRASHRSCVGCHLKKRQSGAAQEAGPVLCVGCHDPQQQLKIARIKSPPPMERKRPQVALIQAPGTRAGPVVFDHRGHEPRARFCSTCHHRGLRSCKECHTLGGDEAKGGGVTLAAAYHTTDSDHSCVGCHKQQTQHAGCKGCHAQLTAPPPRLASCQVCHRPGMAAPASQPTAPLAVPELEPLPLPSDERFPTTVTIKTLAREFKPSVMPHGKIVASLDRAVRGSKLARAFHGKTSTLCAGCHHHSPVGLTPPPCRSCHGAEGRAGEDRPRLFNAYHRQCMGCHARTSGLKNDCTTCHERATNQAEGGR